MPKIDSNLDHELRCAQSCAVWFIRDDGLTAKQADRQLRKAGYIAAHRRLAVAYAAKILVSRAPAFL